MVSPPQGSFRCHAQKPPLKIETWLAAPDGVRKSSAKPIVVVRVDGALKLARSDKLSLREICAQRGSNECLAIRSAIFRLLQHSCGEPFTSTSHSCSNFSIVK